MSRHHIDPCAGEAVLLRRMDTVVTGVAADIEHSTARNFCERDGGLDHHLRLDPRRILLGDLALQRGGDEDIALELERILPARQPGRPGELDHAAALPPVGHHLLDVEPLRVGDGALRFRQSDQHRPAFLEESGGVVPYVAQPLDHDSLARKSGGESQRLHVLPDAADLAHTEEDAAPGGLDTSTDAAGAHGLRGDTAERVHLAWTELGVGVGDPGHLPRTGSHIGRRHVQPRTNEVLAHQLEHVAPGDPLQLIRRVRLRIEADAPLGTTERNVHQRALVGHEGGERLHFLVVHRLGVPDAALAGELVMAVLRPPGVHHLDSAVVALDGEAGVKEVLACLDVGEQGRIVGGESGRAVERPVHLIEEAGADGHGCPPVASGAWRRSAKG